MISAEPCSTNRSSSEGVRLGHWRRARARRSGLRNTSAPSTAAAPPPSAILRRRRFCSAGLSFFFFGGWAVRPALLPLAAPRVVGVPPPPARATPTTMVVTRSPAATSPTTVTVWRLLRSRSSAMRSALSISSSYVCACRMAVASAPVGGGGLCRPPPPNKFPNPPTAAPIAVPTGPSALPAAAPFGCPADQFFGRLRVRVAVHVSTPVPLQG